MPTRSNKFPTHPAADLSRFACRAGLLAAAVALTAACTQVESAPGFSSERASSDDSAITIAETTQGVYGGLHIGVGYVKKAEYTDESGAKKTGLTAGLRIPDPLDPSKTLRMQTHAGQRVSVGEYAFLVQEIRLGLKGSVRLHFEAGSRTPKTPVQAPAQAN
jgi:hypothetical protein